MELLSDKLSQFEHSKCIYLQIDADATVHSFQLGYFEILPEINLKMCF